MEIIKWKFIKWKPVRILIIVAAVVLTIYAGLLISMAFAEPDAHISPDYPKTDIAQVLSQKTLSKADYKMLFYQTGLGESAIDELRSSSADSTKCILYIQDRFFGDVDYICESNSPISREESVVDENGSLVNGTELVSVHNGYILLTKSSHTYGWRNGHAAIIVDDVNGKTLESVVLGTDSCVQELEKWTNFPNFMLLRVKGASAELLEKVSQAAEKNLNDIPYSLTVGVFSPKYPKSGIIDETQCAHLVWAAFHSFGFDLDSDGGMVVTPKDIANSPDLEVVQVYGVSPADIWP